MKINVVDLEHMYPSGDVALKGINFSIENIEPIAIIGQNGSGKTTLVKHLNGILKPTGGDVIIDGTSINDKTIDEWSKTVGYVFQNPDDQLFLESVEKELRFGPEQLGVSENEIDSRLRFVSKLVGLDDKLDVHPFDLNSTQKKFCTIGSVIMMNPKVVIFDEPTCGQDVEGNMRLKNIIKYLYNSNVLCITISHDMKFVVDNFDRIIVMNKGEKILDGNKRNIFKEVEKLKSCHVELPPISDIAHELKLDDKSAIFEIDELFERYKEKYGKE